MENTSYIKFNYQFNEEKLLADLSLVMENKWIPHFNNQGYDGEWKVIPLYAIEGDESNIFAPPNTHSKIKETSLLKNCPYFKEVIDTFKFPILTARILRLGVGAEIKPHRDYELGYEDGNFRIHIPITTNENVSFILDGNKLKMLPGECWYTNVNYVHSVSNKGDTDRVHLVIDGLRNEWSDDLFFSYASKENLLKKPEQDLDQHTMKKMLNELRRSQSPAAQQLIIDLECKLNQA